MAKIHLFETRRIPEAERLRGMGVETLSPLARAGRWRRTMPHVDTHAVLLWIVRGQGRLIVEGCATNYGPGTLAVIPARTPFLVSYGAVTEGTLVRWPELFEAPLPERPVRIRLTDVGTQAELSGLLDKLARRGDLSDAPSGRAALGRIILLSALVERESHRAAAIAPVGDAAERAARFVYAVEAVLPHGASLEAALGRCGDESDAVDAALAESGGGLSAAAYREARVMREARRRLADTEDGVQAVAHDLGFASASALDDAFERDAKMTAGAFFDAERRIAALHRAG